RCWRRRCWPAGDCGTVPKQCWLAWSAGARIPRSSITRRSRARHSASRNARLSSSGVTASCAHLRAASLRLPASGGTASASSSRAPAEPRSILADQLPIHENADLIVHGLGYRCGRVFVRARGEHDADGDERRETTERGGRAASEHGDLLKG